MGELIALRSNKTLAPHEVKAIDRMYRRLIKDIHHFNDDGYVLSDGYDVAQTATLSQIDSEGRSR